MTTAQTPANLSGKWEFDKEKSELSKIDVAYDGTVVLEIIQKPTTISFAEIYSHPERKDWKTSADVYNLSGKEEVRKDSRGTTKKSAKWSQDRKSLTISNLAVQTSGGVKQEFLMEDTYKLSDDGKTLTMERFSKNPVTGELRSKKVYHKK